MDLTDCTAELLALGEPTHFEPAFARLRNDLFARLAEHGFRSIALETDRVAALDGGFSHGLGEVDANRQLLAWLRQYNEKADEPLAFHGFDPPTEMFSAPQPACLPRTRPRLPGPRRRHRRTGRRRRAVEPLRGDPRPGSVARRHRGSP